MTATADKPVESGLQYLITTVEGRQPKGLADFAGEVSLSLTRHDEQMELVGCGAERSGQVRFHQKHPGLHNRDVRVWIISEQGNGRFCAQPLAAF